MDKSEFYELLIERMECLYGKEISNEIRNRYLREKDYLLNFPSRYFQIKLE